MKHDRLVALADAPWVYLTVFAVATIDVLGPVSVSQLDSLVAAVAGRAT